MKYKNKKTRSKYNKTISRKKLLKKLNKNKYNDVKNIQKLRSETLKITIKHKIKSM